MHNTQAATEGWIGAPSVTLIGDGGSAAHGSPRFDKLAKPGSNQAGFGLGMPSVPWRTCLGPRQGTLWLGPWVRRGRRLDSPERGGLGPRDGLRALESSVIGHAGGSRAHRARNRRRWPGEVDGGVDQRRGVDRYSWESRCGVAPGLMILQGGLCGTCDGVQLVRAEQTTAAA